MTALFVVALAVGMPLLLWPACGGGPRSSLRGKSATAVKCLSALPFASTSFGAAGLLLSLSSLAAGIPESGTLLIAGGVGVAGGLFYVVMLRWLHRSEVSSEVTDKALEGSIARVALPVSGQHRGRIVIDAGGSQARMSAAPAISSESDPIEAGAQVLVVKVEAGVALVTRLAPELEAVQAPEPRPLIR